MTDGEEAFMRADAEWFASRDANRDRARVLGYTMVCCDDVTKAKAELEKAVTALERARRRAEKARDHLTWALEHAEAMARCAMAGDPVRNAEVATCLEEWLG